MHRQVLLSRSYHMHMNLVFWIVPADNSTLSVDASTQSVASDLASVPGGGVPPHRFLKQKHFTIKNYMILLHLSM